MLKLDTWAKYVEYNEKKHPPKLNYKDSKPFPSVPAEKQAFRFKLLGYSFFSKYYIKYFNVT